MSDGQQIRYSLVGIVLMIIGGVTLFISGSWIGYVGAIVAVIGAGMVAFVFFRGYLP